MKMLLTPAEQLLQQLLQTEKMNAHYLISVEKTDNFTQLVIKQTYQQHPSLPATNGLLPSPDALTQNHTAATKIN